jgi:hypothetical protein
MDHLSKITIVLCLLTSCRSWDPSMIAMDKEAISPQLLTLERQVEDVASIERMITEDELRLFTQEVEENLLDPFGVKAGYIVYRRSMQDLRLKGIPWTMLNGLTFGTAALLAVPVAIPEHTVEIEVRILDLDRQLLAKYSAVGRGRNVMAMYYGYGLQATFRKTYADAVQDALKAIRPRIQADAPMLNERLTRKLPRP